VLAPDRIGFGGRDLLNVHAALRREQNERLARVRIGQDGRIEFMRDVRLFLDQQALDLVLADAHAQDRRGDALSLLGRIGGLDATRLAALAGRNLCLDHGGSDRANRLGRFLRRAAYLPARHRYAGGREHQRFRRVFVEVHLAPQRPYLSQ
jgi:hypothetical protein